MEVSWGLAAVVLAVALVGLSVVEVLGGQRGHRHQLGWITSLSCQVGWFLMVQGLRGAEKLSGARRIRFELLTNNILTIPMHRTGTGDPIGIWILPGNLTNASRLGIPCQGIERLILERDMTQIDTINFFDIETGGEACAIVRADQGCVALALSLRNGGDVEVFMEPATMKTLIGALQKALDDQKGTPRP